MELTMFAKDRIYCDKCGTAIIPEMYNTTGSECRCGEFLQTTVFPALINKIQNPTENSEKSDFNGASCFFHDSRKAETPCDLCGRFICKLCTIQIGDKKLCPTCIASHTNRDRSRFHRRINIKEDHLRLATRTGSKNYRNFYLKDIQGFLIRKTSTGHLTLLTLISILLFSLSIAFTSQGILQTASIIVSCIIFPFAIYSLAFVQTCKFYIKTASGLTHLSPISRLKDAMKLLNQISPKIISIQGEFDKASLITNSHSPLPPVQIDKRYVDNYNGWAHIATAVTLQLSSITSIFHIISKSSPIPIFLVIGFQFLVGGIASVRQSSKRLPYEMTIIPWVAIALGSLSSISAFIILENSLLPTLSTVTSWPNQDDIWFFSTILQSAVAGITGLMGLGVTISWRKNRDKLTLKEQSEDVS